MIPNLFKIALAGLAAICLAVRKEAVEAEAEGNFQEGEFCSVAETNEHEIYGVSFNYQMTANDGRKGCDHFLCKKYLFLTQMVPTFIKANLDAKRSICTCLADSSIQKGDDDTILFDFRVPKGHSQTVCTPEECWHKYSDVFFMAKRVGTPSLSVTNALKRPEHWEVSCSKSDTIGSGLPPVSALVQDLTIIADNQADGHDIMGVVKQIKHLVEVRHDDNPTPSLPTPLVEARQDDNSTPSPAPIVVTLTVTEPAEEPMPAPVPSGEAEIEGANKAEIEAENKAVQRASVVTTGVVVVAEKPNAPRMLQKVVVLDSSSKEKSCPEVTGCKGSNFTEIRNESDCKTAANMIGRSETYHTSRADAKAKPLVSFCSTKRIRGRKGNSVTHVWFLLPNQNPEHAVHVPHKKDSQVGIVCGCFEDNVQIVENVPVPDDPVIDLSLLVSHSVPAELPVSPETFSEPVSDRPQTDDPIEPPELPVSPQTSSVAVSDQLRTVTDDPIEPAEVPVFPHTVVTPDVSDPVDTCKNKPDEMDRAICLCGLANRFQGKERSDQCFALGKEAMLSASPWTCTMSKSKKNDKSCGAFMTNIMQMNYVGYARRI